MSSEHQEEEVKSVQMPLVDESEKMQEGNEEGSVKEEPMDVVKSEKHLPDDSSSSASVPAFLPKEVETQKALKQAEAPKALTKADAPKALKKAETPKDLEEVDAPKTLEDFEAEKALLEVEVPKGAIEKEGENLDASSSSSAPARLTRTRDDISDLIRSKTRQRRSSIPAVLDPEQIPIGRRPKKTSAPPTRRCRDPTGGCHSRCRAFMDSDWFGLMSPNPFQFQPHLIPTRRSNRCPSAGEFSGETFPPAAARPRFPTPSRFAHLPYPIHSFGWVPSDGPIDPVQIIEEAGNLHRHTPWEEYEKYFILRMCPPQMRRNLEPQIEKDFAEFLRCFLAEAETYNNEL